MTIEVLTEEKLVVLLKERSKIGFDYLYSKYSAALYGTICKIVTEKHIAEEVLQEVFQKVYSQFASYTPANERLYTWLSNIARNTAIDKTRSKEKNQKLRMAEGNACPSTQTQNIDIIGIDSLISKLPKNNHEIICLCYYHGHPMTQVSLILDLPLETVKRRLRQTILMLRKINYIGKTGIPADIFRI